MKFKSNTVRWIRVDLCKSWHSERTLGTISLVVVLFLGYKLLSDDWTRLQLFSPLMVFIVWGAVSVYLISKNSPDRPFPTKQLTSGLCLALASVVFVLLLESIGLFGSILIGLSLSMKVLGVFPLWKVLAISLTIASLLSLVFQNL